MRTAVRLLAAAGLALGGTALGGGVAQAATVIGDPCSEIDYTGAIGTTFAFPFNPDCFVGDYDAEGSPSINVVWGGQDGQPLVWYQSVGRTGDSCEDGWTASWAQWPNDGAGGPTCDRTIVWGTGPGDARQMLAITINTDDDFVNLDSAGDNYVTGCDVDEDFYDNHVVVGCTG